MDFNLSEEQEALQEMASDFIRERWPADQAREALDKRPAVIAEDVWQEILEMGWLGVAAGEDVGGIGGDVMTAAVLSQEAGRGLLPGPFQSSLAAVLVVERSRNDAVRKELVPQLIDGSLRATVAVEEPGGRYGPDSVAAEVRADTGGWRLSGSKLLVADADAAALLIVAARTPNGLGWVRVRRDAEGVEVRKMERMDAQSCSEVVFENAPVEGDALLGDERALREAYEIWTALLAADLLGSAEASLELTRRYAIERVQFGRPIGTFQAVSHRLADNLVDVEIGRSLLYGACLALDEKRDNAAPLISAAKAWLSDTAVTAAESALQIHGGVGFTWEYDVHLHMRRSRCNAAILGDADHHRDRVAEYMDSSWVPPIKS